MPDATPSTDTTVVERTFDAPPSLLWRLWTEPDLFATWFGPDGATVPEASLDLRVGGRRRVTMEMATEDGARRMWFTGEFREVVEPERLVYTEAMADEDGNPTSPLTEVRVDLEDLGGRTRVVVSHVGVPPGSPGASGWAMALAKLADRVGQPDVRPSGARGRG